MANRWPPQDHQDVQDAIQALRDFVPYKPAYEHPYPVKVDARASLGKQNAARPDAPVVDWFVNAGQADPPGFKKGGVDPKYPGDNVYYETTA